MVSRGSSTSSIIKSAQAIAVNQSTRQRIQKDSKAKVKKEQVLTQYRLYGLTDNEINASKTLLVSIRTMLAGRITTH